MIWRISQRLNIVMTQVQAFVCQNSLQLFLEGCTENPITYIDGESNHEVPYQQIVSLIELSACATVSLVVL